MATRLMRYFIVIAICLTVITGNARADTAKGVIETYHQQLLAALSAPTSINDKTRFDALSPAMDKAFDFQTMIKTVVGRHWGRSDEATQTSLIKAFRKVSIATYADQFAGLKKGRFVIDGTRPGPKGLMLVDSTLKTPDEDVALTYVVREKNGSWQIIDVLLDGGISELALRASEYAQILKTDGTDGLITSLNNQTSNLLQN